MRGAGERPGPKRGTSPLPSAAAASAWWLFKLKSTRTKKSVPQLHHPRFKCPGTTAPEVPATSLGSTERRPFHQGRRFHSTALVWILAHVLTSETGPRGKLEPPWSLTLHPWLCSHANLEEAQELCPFLRGQQPLGRQERRGRGNAVNPAESAFSASPVMPQTCECLSVMGDSGAPRPPTPGPLALGDFGSLDLPVVFSRTFRRS